jgi:hypothetical protein
MADARSLPRKDAFVMSVASDLADEITEKLERGRFDRDLIDTLCGGLIRLFARLERHERRLVALERRLVPRPPRAPAARAGDSTTQSKRGRPLGARNRPKPVVVAIEMGSRAPAVHYEDHPAAVAGG